MKSTTIKKITLSMLATAVSALVIGATPAHAEKDGYLVDTRMNVVKDNYNECWKTGYWTPALAIEECDPVLTKAEAPAPMSPKPSMQTPPPPAMKPISLQAETLFDFDKAVVRPTGKQILDEQVVAKMRQYPQVELVLLSGYTDRIGSDSYNQKLSERRAAAVKSYLVSQGIAASRIDTVGKGKADPLVSCSEVKGKANHKNKALVACLQPNRRVTVEVERQGPAK